MAEALRLVVATVVLEVLVLFGAIVPGQLQKSLAVARLAVLGQALRARVGEEVEVEAGRLRLVGPDEGHSHDVLVELERLFGVLDADHGMVL